MSLVRTIYKMKIEKIVDHTENVRELILRTDAPSEFKFRAGQFAMLHVPQENAKPALRAYSIASDDREVNGFTLLFKYVENGVASKFVWSLKGDETLHFTGPFGKVFFQEPPTDQIIFLNTGTGVSQHLSYLYSMDEIYPHLQYKMLFGVRKESDIYYQAQLEDLKNQLPHFTYEFILSQPSPSWKGRKGYVQDFISEFNYLKIPSTFYLCGNGGMIKNVKSILEEAQFDKTRVWAEAFD